MSDQQDTNPKTYCRGFFRFHRSTLLIASLMLLPWLLVALPGRKTGGTSTTTGLTTEYLHGLPFAFLERQSVVNWRGNFGLCGPIVSLDTWSEDVWSEGLESTSIEERGFWSDSTRWPWIGEADAEAMRIRWWGLLADLSLLLVACWVLARIVESRLKNRASHFAFSLAELLTAICITGVFFAWITTEYRRATKENRAVDRLDLAVNAANGVRYGERGNGLPILVSELFDHRSYLPLLECHLFRPVEHVQIFLPNEPKGETLALLEAIRNVDFPLHFRGDINKDNLPILKGLNDLATVKQLNLSFAFDPEQDKQTGVYRYDVNWDFKLILPEADQLVISLQPEIDQEKQLGIFAPMKHFKSLEIHGLNRAGATYLNSIAKDLPNEIRVEFKSKDERIELSYPTKPTRSGFGS